MGSLRANLLVLRRTKGSSMATTGSDAFNWFEVPRPFLVPTLRALSLIRRVEAGMADTGGVTGQGSRADRLFRAGSSPAARQINDMSED